MASSLPDTGCVGCANDSDPVPPPATGTFSITDLGPPAAEVTYTMDLAVQITVYGTFCEEILPPVCDPVDQCNIYATVKYKSTIAGVDISVWTLLGGSTQLASNLPAVNVWRYVYERRESVDCGEGSTAFFYADGPADPGEFNTLSIEYAWGCSACEWVNQ